MHVNCAEMNLDYKAMNKVCAKTRFTFKGILHLILALLSLKNNSAFFIVECLEQTAVATSVLFFMNGEKPGGGGCKDFTKYTSVILLLPAIN